ncbi:MAG: hypothetical protein ACREOZ_02540, partial [Gloeomargaritales cyanobacterium]
SLLAHLVHVSAINIISTVFRRCSCHWSIILKDLFPILLKLPTLKRLLRTFRLRLVPDSVDGITNTGHLSLIGDGGGSAVGKLSP